MKIRRIKKLRVTTTDFIIKWDNSFDGASFNYWDKELKIGTRDIDDLQLFNRNSDYIFVFDHRQNHTMILRV